MSKLISGKEALIALANGEDVEFQRDDSGKWKNAMTLNLFSFNSSLFKFRLKLRTVNLNGVEVSRPESCDWSFSDPSEVILKFKSREEALNFHENILKIFSKIK